MLVWRWFPISFSLLFCPAVCYDLQYFIRPKSWQEVDPAAYLTPATRALSWKRQGWRLTGKYNSWNDDCKWNFYFSYYFLIHCSCVTVGRKCKLLSKGILLQGLFHCSLLSCYTIVPENSNLFFFWPCPDLFCSLNALQFHLSCYISNLISALTGHPSQQGWPLLMDSHWGRRQSIDPIQR
jgi:hypothetical protein